MGAATPTAPKLLAHGRNHRGNVMRDHDSSVLSSKSQNRGIVLPCHLGYVLYTNNVKAWNPPHNTSHNGVTKVLVGEPLHRFFRRASNRSRNPRGDHSASCAASTFCSSRPRRSK